MEEIKELLIRANEKLDRISVLGNVFYVIYICICIYFMYVFLCMYLFFITNYR